MKTLDDASVDTMIASAQFEGEHAALGDLRIGADPKLDDEERRDFDYWLRSYDDDAAALGRLSEADRARVYAAGWEAYCAKIRQAQAARRS